MAAKAISGRTGQPADRSRYAYAAAAFDRAWHESARFRAAERAMTIGLGIVLLANLLPAQNA